MKYNETSIAVNAVRNHLIMLIAMNDEHERDKEKYLEKELGKRDEDRELKYKINMQKVNSAILAFKEKLNSVINYENDPANAMKDISKEDIELLKLPVTLSADELRILFKRNESNSLFRRALSEYIESRNIEDAADLKAEQLHTSKLAHNRDLILGYLNSYVRVDFFDAMRYAVGDYKVFTSIIENGTFEKLGG